MPPHVADRVERGDDPEERGDQREQHAERLDDEADAEPGDEIEQEELGPPARLDRRKDAVDREEGDDRGRDHRAVAEVGPAPEQRDQRRARERAGKRHRHGEFDAHGPAPINARAACSATPTGSEVSIPK